MEYFLEVANNIRGVSIVYILLYLAVFALIVAISDYNGAPIEWPRRPFQYFAIVAIVAIIFIPKN